VSLDRSCVASQRCAAPRLPRRDSQCAGWSRSGTPGGRRATPTTGSTRGRPRRATAVAADATTTDTPTATSTGRGPGGVEVGRVMTPPAVERRTYAALPLVGCGRSPVTGAGPGVASSLAFAES